MRNPPPIGSLVVKRWNNKVYRVSGRRKGYNQVYLENNQTYSDVSDPGCWGYSVESLRYARPEEILKWRLSR